MSIMTTESTVSSFEGSHAEGLEPGPSANEGTQEPSSVEPIEDHRELSDTGERTKNHDAEKSQDYAYIKPDEDSMEGAPRPLPPGLENEQKSGSQQTSDNDKIQDERPSVSPSPAPFPVESASRLNHIRLKQKELADHYSTLAAALAAALARRVNHSLTKVDKNSISDPDSVLVTEVHESNAGLRPKKEKPLHLRNYQRDQIKSNAATNVGVIWRDFYKQRSELKWRMHEELIRKISRLQEEKGLLCRSRTSLTPLEVISNNLDTVRNLGSSPDLRKLDSKSIEHDLKLLKRKADAAESDNSEDESWDSDRIEQDAHALLYEPSQQQNSSLYKLAVVAQPPGDQLMDLLAAGNNELAQPPAPKSHPVMAAPPMPPLPQEFVPAPLQQQNPEQFAQPWTAPQPPQPEAPQVPQTQPQFAPYADRGRQVSREQSERSRTRSRAESASSARTHKRSSSQQQAAAKKTPTSRYRSPARHRKTNSGSKHSPPLKRARVDRSPSMTRQSPAVAPQIAPPMANMTPQMGQPSLPLQPQQMQVPIQGMQIGTPNPSHIQVPMQMPVMSPLAHQPQLPGAQPSQMPYGQPQLLPGMYQGQQIPPQMQIPPMQMQMPMPGYGVPSVYEQGGMQGVPMGVYPGGMPQLMPVYGDMFFQGQMMQQMPAYPQYDDKGNPVYYPVTQVGPAWPNAS